jgi:hypothetical protein
MLTAAGHDYNNVLHLKELQRLERAQRTMAKSGVVWNTTSGANVDADGGVVESLCEEDIVTPVRDGGATADASECAYVDVVDGGASVEKLVTANDDLLFPGTVNLTPSEEVLSYFLCFLASSAFPDQIDNDSMEQHEVDIVCQHCFSITTSVALRLSIPHNFNLSKEPFSYAEAVARPDASIWHAAMEREMASLKEMGVFAEEDLPKGEKAIGLKWVYAHKTDAAGHIIEGKAKARVVAQGFNQ